MHKKYQKQLLAEKVVKEDDLKRMQEHISGIMSKEFEGARDYKPEVRSCTCRAQPVSATQHLYGFALKPTASNTTKQSEAAHSHHSPARPSNPEQI